MSEATSEPIEYSLEDKFYACVEIIQAMPKSGPLNPTIGEKLNMYSLFKQVTEGPCNTIQPAFWNLIERLKWDAWKQLGDLDKSEAMEKYVAFVLEKIDYCAEHWDWDEMMEKYSDEKMGPVLRIKFRIIDRELIKEDGTRVNRDRISTNKRPISEEEQSSNPRKEKIPRGDFGILETAKASPSNQDGPIIEERSFSRSSNTLSDSPRTHSNRSRRVSTLCAKIDGELRSINANLNSINEATEVRHKAFMKIIKSSTIYIAVPSNLSWRSHFFLLIWPFIVHWAIKYYRWFAAVFIDFIREQSC
ncbi:hypothetical protein PRIPAC_82025 [Pristionchus pacificus]|nr:hypothetical protein PRIPAC_82025 [Pristionchus pacificus]